MKRIWIGLLCGPLLAGGIASAQQNSIRVENAWSRAAQQGGTGVVYLTVVDDGAPDRLMGIASPVAAQAQLHESFTDRGVAKMREVPAATVESGKPLTLAPGGYHIMLMNLKQPLHPGDTFPVTLSFEKAGQVTATASVQAAGRTMPMGGMPMHGDAQKSP